MLRHHDDELSTNAPFGRFSCMMMLCISDRILCFFSNEPRNQQKMVPACQECWEVVIDASSVHCIALRHWIQRTPEKVTDKGISSSSLLQNPPELSVHLAKEPSVVPFLFRGWAWWQGQTDIHHRLMNKRMSKKKLREFGLVKIKILPLLSSLHYVVRKNKV